MVSKNLIEDDVAIMLSTYNGEEYLDEQLKSIYEQTYKSIKLYVRDDGSNDNTLQIIDKWSAKMDITVIESEMNVGPAKSFLEIVKKVGEHAVYAFCDQDDIWDNDKVEIAMKRLTQSSEVPTLYFSNSRLINNVGEVIAETTHLEAPIITFESEVVCGYCPGCAMFFNRTLLELVNAENYSSVPMHDTLFVLTALAVGNVIYDKIPRFSRRMHAHNVVGKKGKNFLGKIKQTVSTWFVNSKKCPLNQFAYELYDNLKVIGDLNLNESELLKLIDYKKGIKNKLVIYKSAAYTTKNKRALRSFHIRLFLNLL